MTLTLDAWEALPETEGLRLECVRGEVVVVPRPQGGHQAAVGDLYLALSSALPPTMRALLETELILATDPLTVRNPDLVAIDADIDLSAHVYRPDQVHLVIEVLSPSTRRTDRVVKLAEYAAAGIPDYWIVDRDGPSLSRHLLTSRGVYQLTAEHTGRAEIATCGTTVHVDVPTLGT